MPAIVFFIIFCADINTFTMLVFHFRLVSKVFSVDFSIPVWWEIIPISIVWLLDPENIGLAVEILFPSCLQSWDISTSSLMIAILDFLTSGFFLFGHTTLPLSLFDSWTPKKA